MEIDRYDNKGWFNVNRKLHRENDLPAVEYTNGDKLWFVNGKYYIASVVWRLLNWHMVVNNGTFMENNTHMNRYVIITKS
jgi:hypothetical protein